MTIDRYHKWVNAYLIDPYAANVTNLRISSGGDAEIFKALKCDSFRVGGYLPTGDVIYVEHNETEKDNPHTNYFRIPSVSAHPLAGRGVVVGVTDAEGLATDAAITAEGLVQAIHWVYSLNDDGTATFEVKATRDWSLNTEEVVV